MKQSVSILTLVLIFLPAMASAHSGAGATTGWMHGFGHPMSGADHLLAMAAVGLWASQIGGRALWAVPLTFVGVMIVGGLLGYAGIPVPFIEEGILVSVLILGILVAGAYKLPPVYCALTIGAFAVFHGHAHGTEMPPSAGAAAYTLGFALATAILHLAGWVWGCLRGKRTC